MFQSCHWTVSRSKEDMILWIADCYEEQSSHPSNLYKSPFKLHQIAMCEAADGFTAVGALICRILRRFADHVETDA